MTNERGGGGGGGGGGEGKASGDFNSLNTKEAFQMSHRVEGERNRASITFTVPPLLENRKKMYIKRKWKFAIFVDKLAESAESFI